MGRQTMRTIVLSWRVYLVFGRPDVPGVNRSGVKFAGVNRSGVKFTGVNRSGVNMITVKFTGVDRSGVKIYWREQKWCE